MNICIPVTENKGLDSTVSKHFGRAPFQMVVHLEDESFKMIDKGNECDDSTHGHCMPVQLLLAHAVDVVACQGIGKGAMTRLKSNGIHVFATPAGKVSDVLKAFKENRLNLLPEDDVCQGHHH